MQNLDVGLNQETNHGESYDDGECEWNSGNSIDLYDLASAAGRLAGNLNNKPGALDEFFNKLKVLEHEWYEGEKRYNKLKMENDRLNNQLIHEKTKCTIYQKKLKFIQDNQKNFEKLKEVYLAMKQQEYKRQSTENLREQEIQTLDFGTGIFESRGTLTTTILTCDKGVLTKYHGNVLQTDSMIAIRRSELTDAHENLQLLKDMIKKREYSWSVNIQREESMKEEIRTLQEDKRVLETAVRMKDIELKTMRNLRGQNPDSQDNVNNMKRIIGKLSRRLRDLEKVERGGRLCSTLDDDEKAVIKDIENSDSFAKRPQMLKPQPAKLNTNRSFPGSSAAKGTKAVKSPLSTIIENKSKSMSGSSEEYDSETQELEVLGQMKKSIEEKQAALKEKVQQIINYSEKKEGQKV